MTTTSRHPPEPTRGSVRSWGWRVVQLVLTVVVTVAVVRRVGLGLDDLATLDPGWWRPRWAMALASSVVLALGYVVSAWLWGRMVRELGGGRIPGARAVRIFMTANLARYVPGKVWQIAGLALLARREGVGPMVSTAAAVLGQGAALAGATLLGTGALLAAGGGVRTWGWVALSSVGIGVLLASIPKVARVAARAWFRLARTPAPETLRPGGTFAIRWVALYWLNWLVYAGAFWLLATSYDVNGSFMEIGAAFAAAYVIGYVAVFAPAGIGVRESFLVAFLAPLVGPAPAGGLAIVSRVWTTAVEVLAALGTSGIRLAEVSDPPGGAA